MIAVDDIGRAQDDELVVEVQNLADMLARIAARGESVKAIAWKLALVAAEIERRAL